MTVSGLRRGSLISALEKDRRACHKCLVVKRSKHGEPSLMKINHGLLQMKPNGYYYYSYNMVTITLTIP